MKRKIVIGLALFSWIFSLGGLYVIFTIEDTTSKLNTLITLHKVEILREHLLIHVKRVQSDLTLKNTRHARGINIIAEDLRNMFKTQSACFRCHHSEDMTKRLTDLKSHMEEYGGMVSRALTMRANTARLEEDEEEAFKAGEAVINEVNTMISVASGKLEDKTNLALVKIRNTKFVLYALVALAPVFATLLGLVFVRAFTIPLGALLTATRRLRSGDLKHRIEGLKDEYGEVAESFNEMAVSLREHLSKLQESEKRYRMLFESAGDAIFILEAEGRRPGRIVAANEAAARMHGYTVEELLTLAITDLDSPDDAVKVPDRIERILRGEWMNIEMAHRRKDGSVFPVEVSAGLLELGDHKYILAFDRDITERRRAEDSMQRAEQIKIVGELAAGLAHEIKNPLAGIKVSMEVLSGEATVSSADKEVLSAVISEIKRIESLIQELLNFAKPPQSQIREENINGILDATVNFAMANVSSSSDGRRPIAVAKDFDESIPEAMVDALQMKQVFLNLLLNAVDAMPTGGRLTLKTSYDEVRNSSRVEISDTGEGIPRESIDKIFQPFFTTKVKGSGLGLAICKRLIEQQGGSLEARNNPEGGATFIISLPVRHQVAVIYHET
ncbi:MAG: ATP-binding protein [Chloroflexota bacterium]